MVNKVDLTDVPTKELAGAILRRSDDCIVIQYRRMHNTDPEFRFWSTTNFPRLAYLCGYTHDFLVGALDDDESPDEDMEADVDDDEDEDIHDPVT